MEISNSTAGLEHLLYHVPMPDRQVALVAETKRISARELKAAERALAKQINEHLGPKWDLSASIQAYEGMKDVPEDCWPVLVRDTIQVPGMMGIHTIQNGRPYAEITFMEGWQFGASHDTLEMLVDPSCTRVTAAPSVRPGDNRKVQYSVQICDPSGTDPRFGYDIDGIRVANFCTPQYYDPRRKRGAPLSQTGSITKALEILKGGYLTWFDPKTNQWWQKVWWNDRPEYRVLGTADPPGKGTAPEVTKLTLQEMIAEVQEGQHAVAVRKNVERLIRKYGKR